ncbi:MAG TPA: SDR family oxidoreductase [Thiobacillaceae bacterium]|nr:SDR family oxidoreductase [Thiobacillaceae bacterium]
MKKNKLLIVGCGDIGMRVAQGHHPVQIRGLARSGESAQRLRSQGITPVVGDLDRRASLDRLSGLAPWVLHLGPPPGDSDGDPRTRRLVAALAKGGSLPRRLVYISTSGVYGNCDGERVAETRTPAPETPRARRRVDAERLLRRFAARHGIQLSILRAPGIYAQDRLPLERIQKRTPAVRAEEDSYTNHIHAEDLAKTVWLALFRGRPNRIYHAADGSVKKMGDYFDLVADHFGLPRCPRILRAEAQQVLSPALLSFLNESRILDNTRLKQELKVRLTYPDVAAALEAMGRPHGETRPQSRRR